MAALFNDGSNSIKQTVQLDDGSFGTAERTEEWYDVDGTYRVIKDGMYKRVALQFPDWLLCDSPRVVAAIIARDPEWFRPEGGYATLFVLGDTAYGSCCVDEVAAEHYSADLVVHYGHACLSRTSQKPVYFVFGKSPIDCGKLLASLDAQVGPEAGASSDHPLLVVCHVSYLYRSILSRRLCCHDRMRASPRWERKVAFLNPNLAYQKRRK